MATFQERQKGFEAKFARDQDLKFKAEARRNNLIGAWAAEKLGLTGDAVAEYQKEVRRADLIEKGDDDVVRKIRSDFDAKGINISDDEIRAQMIDFMAQAIAQIEGGSGNRTREASLSCAAARPLHSTDTNGFGGQLRSAP